MPYIYCEACGVGLYSNVTSCPSCGAPARRAYARNQARRARTRAGSAHVREDVEIEVRDMLYGRPSSSVERVPGG
jgi:hypothetical protein